MRAIVISKPGGPEVLEVRDVEMPAPCRGEVRVRVSATACNRADLLQRLGKYPAPPGAPPDIPGLEVAGEVDAVGGNVTEFAIGDRVFGIVNGGGYAEYVVAHARTLVRLPEALTFVQGAAIPEVFVTAWDAMIDQAHLTAGETVLIHAVGSGVGTAALQIANAIGASTIGTTRSADKLARARELGLAECILTPHGAFASQVRAITGQRGADVILELVGGSYFAEDLGCLASKGRIVVVGLLEGAKIEFDFGTLMHKRGRVFGTVMRARPLEDKIVAARALERHMVPLFARGTLRPVIDRVLPLDHAAEGHRILEGGAAFGKVVLEVRSA